VQGIKPLEQRSDDIAILVVRVDDESSANFQLDLSAARLEDLSDARRASSSWLLDRGVPEPVTEELAIVVSELLANAVLSEPDHRTQLSIRSMTGHVEIEVVNAATPERPLEPRLPDPTASSGRGLFVAAALVDELDTTAEGGLVRVRARRRFAGEGNDRAPEPGR
jgi:anti-sigma regulatory factor (Ser/Thr protein kinase)